MKMTTLIKIIMIAMAYIKSSQLRRNSRYQNTESIQSSKCILWRGKKINTTAIAGNQTMII